MFVVASVIALTLCSSPGPRAWCVADGNTFWHANEQVRISDIDAPNRNGSCAAERALAIRARNRLLALLNGAPYRVYRHGKDPQGRTLAIVTTRSRLGGGSRSLGARLLAEGLASQSTGKLGPWC